MNKISKRIVAGASALALLASAVGVDQLADLFMKTSYADSTSTSTRNGKSTGFNNLEQDTTTGNDKYNTGYGLHTNKTATAVDDDGRTFDVDLESWYVGENPVDVATILDASGSMAWTVDTLEPLEINYETCFATYNATHSGMGEIHSLTDLQKIQEANDGYLPQDVIDCILNPKNTDNSKLSYADYMYYIYESRSSVSEFVPLGYWDGGYDLDTIDTDKNVIGYYPFDGSLKNKKSSDSAKIIDHPARNIFNKEPLTEEAKLDYSSYNGLDLTAADRYGNVYLDIADKSNFDFSNFTVEFEYFAQDASNDHYANTPIFYIGSADKSQYYMLNRGSSVNNSSSVGKSNSERLEMQVTGDRIFQAKNQFKCGTVLKVKLVVEANKAKIYIDDKEMDFDSPTSKGNGTISSPLSLGDNFVIMLGGDELIDQKNFSGGISQNNIKSIKITSQSKVFCNFDLTSDNGDVRFVKQTTDSENFNTTDAPDPLPVEAVYSDRKNSGSKSLNLTDTKDIGAVLLDAVPKDANNFSISFAVTNSNEKEESGKPSHEAEIVYMGSLDTTKNYYNIFRSQNIDKSQRGAGDSKHIRFSENSDYSNRASGASAFNQEKWSVVTFTVKDGTLTAYVNGAKVETAGGSTLIAKNKLTSDDFNIILGGLVDDYDGKDILIDDLYVFNKALTYAEVIRYTDTACKAGQYHATQIVNGEVTDIAQISKSLHENNTDHERRGWYYVNSASNWNDISGCLESGKQYIGIYDSGKDNTDESERTGLYVDDAGKDIATVPSGASSDLQADIEAGNTDEKDTTNEDKKFNKSPTNERSIRFYVDTVGHLRCFAWSGSTSKATDIRTFCSLVYEKGENSDGTEQITKYEALNDALNGFYSELAKGSDLSNSAIVRFSTNNTIDGDNTDKNLEMLIMKDWTNWSEFYQGLTEDEKKDTNNKSKYMADLLIPADGETSTYTTTSTAQKIEEYPYVMTGGTYTWTGLKSFYDNMVNKESGRVYDIANDARDKYLIIFTDGRDNLVDSTATNYEDYLPEGITPTNSDGSTITDVHDGDLAKAWADKLKSEGYTIFCVMMAAGSISKDANPDEYDKAKAFVTSLAGEKVNDKNAEKYVSVIGAGAGEEGSVNNVSDAFQNILNQIQQPRADYTVQDYIDPRFDLVDANDNLYKLGAGGKITVKSAAGTTINEVTVGNIIDNIDATDITGLAYTPRKSEMVNRTSNDDGGDVGTGYIYYDNVKDMYYLRWTDQIIPMENKAFDTDTDPAKKTLDVWSATIRLKAKDDFIGGNNILTNGNEAGENLVYSDATIENMDKNPTLYFTEDELNEYTDVAGKINIPYREKLKVLSGTNRKINAVDADGVSQAVYGDGIDIPSSGFPRTTVNVRLLKLDAKNLNDVIYMGEVVSPTMMLADLENDYMTGSYYLEYLERYAYRLYGKDTDKTPLLDLLNEWLKIDDKDEMSKTFTIPYIYLPDPEYGDDGKLKKSDEKVVIQNSTGASWKGNELDFDDLNLRDVTGFITYTWKREDKDTNGDGNIDGEERESQQVDSSTDKYDITKDYVAKNTDQIKYNLQLKFTPLKETAAGLDNFTLDENFINADTTTHTGGDKFFNIGSDGEFNTTGVTKWSIAGREDYLKAMIQETRTYEPHVMYDEDATGGGKWVLVDEDDTNHTPEKAVAAYKEADKSGQTTVGTDNKTVTDVGVYDWDNDYKPEAGNEQIEKGQSYTNTPDNVKVESYSLVANTTYTKDVVNGALALELVVDGKYLKKDPINDTEPEIKGGKEYEFIAKRGYNDPLDPLPYGDTVYADTYGDLVNRNGFGRRYRLTFTVDIASIPKDPQENQLYTVWAKLTKVEVEECEAGGVRTGKYTPITDTATTNNPYLGYEKPDALPIGTYSIIDSDNPLSGSQFKIADAATAGQSNDLYFKYLNADSDTSSYKHDRFPDQVVEVSADAAKDANDGDYQIWNTSKDNSSKNIAESKSVSDRSRQEVTFYFGTVDVSSYAENKGESVKDDPETTNDYAKDRLGIIMLSVDPNSLAITKEVTNTTASTKTHESDDWKFTVTIKTSDRQWLSNKGLIPSGGTFDYTLYERDTSGNWVTGKVQQATVDRPSDEHVDDVYIYTLTIHLTLQHNQKAVFRDLPNGTWQVTEETMSDVLYTPHNNANGLGEDEWRYQNSAATNVNTLNPISQVDFENEFPYELPSAGGSGTLKFVLLGTLLTAVGAMLFVVLYFDRRKKARK